MATVCHVGSLAATTGWILMSGLDTVFWGNFGGVSGSVWRGLPGLPEIKFEKILKKILLISFNPYSNDRPSARKPRPARPTRAAMGGATIFSRSLFQRDELPL